MNLATDPRLVPFQRSVWNLQNGTNLGSVALFAKEQHSSKADAISGNCRVSFGEDSILLEEDVFDGGTPISMVGGNILVLD